MYRFVDNINVIYSTLNSSLITQGVLPGVVERTCYFRVKWRHLASD